jgi:predicted lactoylglutathione lyase
MLDMKVSDVRPFVPSKDFAVSKEFYAALGWVVHPIDDSLALLENGNHRFYLQNYYTKEFAENMMLHVTVADARASSEQIKQLLASDRFPGARVSQPKQESYGAIVTYVWDPAGVLLHLAQWIDQ